MSKHSPTRTVDRAHLFPDQLVGLRLQLPQVRLSYRRDRLARAGGFLHRGYRRHRRGLVVRARCVLLPHQRPPHHGLHRGDPADQAVEVPPRDVSPPHPLHRHRKVELEVGQRLVRRPSMQWVRVQQVCPQQRSRSEPRSEPQPKPIVAALTYHRLSQHRLHVLLVQMPAARLVLEVRRALQHRIPEGDCNTAPSI